MLLYNMTIAIDRDAEQTWKSWMTEQQIPAVEATGIFSKAMFFRVVTHDDPVTSSYCLQLFAEDITALNRWLDQHAKSFLAEMQRRYPDKHAVFQTLLEQC